MARSIPLSLAIMAGIASSGTVFAQGGPTPDQAVNYINERLEANASSWLPCRGAAKLELDENGYLMIETSRQAFCEDSLQKVHLSQLDGSSLTVELEQQAMIRIDCLEAGCARLFEKRKAHSEGDWTPRTEDWIPTPPRSGLFIADSVVLSLGSNQRAAEEIGTALGYLIGQAGGVPAFQKPASPFVVAAAAPPATP